jgi:hypothetical protein
MADPVTEIVSWSQPKAHGHRHGERKDEQVERACALVTRLWVAMRNRCAPSGDAPLVDGSLEAICNESRTAKPATGS